MIRGSLIQVTRSCISYLNVCSVSNRSTVRILADHQALLSGDPNLAEHHNRDVKSGRQGILGLESLSLSHDDLCLCAADWFLFPVFQRA